MQVLPPPPASRGPDILTNPVILESILPELPHLSDILSLQLVSRQLYLLVQPLHPLYAREISFACLPEVKNKDIITVLHRSLRPGPSTQRRLLADGRMVTVGEGMGKAYVGPWRFLRAITLTGTSISSRSVKLLIAASSGGKIPGLPELLRERRMTMDSNGDPDPGVDTHGVTSGFFAKEFGVVSPGAYRLLADQSLRLHKLCITDCPQVDITDINNFLKKILIAVTAPKRRELRLRATQQAAAAQHQNGPANAVPLGAAAANANIGVLLAQQQAQQQQQVQPLQEDLTSIPYPLPATVDELAEFGLPCLSLRRLEVANVNGLYVDPPERFRGKKEWSYSKDCPFGRNIGSLNSIAGCLGLDVDVLFCQGAGCSTSSDNSRWRQSNPYGFDIDDFDSFDGIIPDLANSREHNPQAPSQTGETSTSGNNDRINARRSYHYPLPRLPGERILMAEDGRVFRIPRHALPNTINQPQQIQQMNQQLNQQINQQTPQQYALNIMNVMHPGANHHLLLNIPGVAGAGAGVGAGAGAVATFNNTAWNGGNGANGANGANGGNGGGANGWASNLFLQDPAQYGLGVWHQPQQNDNQTQTAVTDQTLMQMSIQAYPGAGADTGLPSNAAIAPLNATPAVTVTPHQQNQLTTVPLEAAPAESATVDSTVTPFVDTVVTDSSQGDNVDDLDDAGHQDNTLMFTDDDLVPSFTSSMNEGGPSTESNNAAWQGLLSASAADVDGVQTPPYGQVSLNNGLSQLSASEPSTTAGPSSAPPPPSSTPSSTTTLSVDSTTEMTQVPASPSNLNVAVAPPQPNMLPAVDPLVGLQWPPGQAPTPAQNQNQGTISDIDQIAPTVAGAGIGNHPHLNQFAQMIQPYLPATGTGIGNPHPHLVGGFAPMIQPHLPRRRNNSLRGIRGGTNQTGTRPGRRIAMLDGPRGLCERCEREVWLCDSCNRYWVVTCGGCAAKQ